MWEILSGPRMPRLTLSRLGETNNCPYCLCIFSKAGCLARHIDQYRLNDLNSPGSSVSSGSEVAGFYWNHDATEPERESCEKRSDNEAGTVSADEEADAPPHEPKSMVEVYPGSALTMGDVEDYNTHLDELWNPWAPFYDAWEWQLARWFIRS